MTQLYIIAGYLALLLGLGLFSSTLFKGTSKDYMLASHSIGPVLLLMSIFGTTMTAFALVGSTGEAFRTAVGVYGMLASLAIPSREIVSRDLHAGSAHLTALLLRLHHRNAHYLHGSG